MRLDYVDGSVAKTSIEDHTEQVPPHVASLVCLSEFYVLGGQLRLVSKDARVV